MTDARAGEAPKIQSTFSKMENVWCIKTVCLYPGILVTNRLDHDTKYAAILPSKLSLDMGKVSVRTHPPHV